MRILLLTLLFVLGCATSSQGRDGFTTETFYLCEGKEYFYDISVSDGKYLTLRLDPDHHPDDDQIVFLKSECVKKEREVKLSDDFTF